MNKKLSMIFSGLLSAAVMVSAAPMTVLTANAAKTAAPSAAYIDEDTEVIGGAVGYSIAELGDDHIIRNLSDYYNQADGNVKDLTPAAAPGAGLPSKVDNSKNQNAKYLPQVRSQGGIGSCCAWSSVYYQFTYTLNKARGIATSLCRSMFQRR